MKIEKEFLNKREEIKRIGEKIKIIDDGEVLKR